MSGLYTNQFSKLLTTNHQLPTLYKLPDHLYRVPGGYLAELEVVHQLIVVEVIRDTAQYREGHTVAVAHSAHGGALHLARESAEVIRYTLDEIRFA